MTPQEEPSPAERPSGPARLERPRRSRRGGRGRRRPAGPAAAKSATESQSAAETVEPLADGPVVGQSPAEDSPLEDAQIDTSFEKSPAEAGDASSFDELAQRDPRAFREPREPEPQETEPSGDLREAQPVRAPARPQPFARRDFKPAEPKAVTEAIEEVNQIIATLRQTLDQMEEVLETLELAEVQKTADEREIQALRTALKQLDRRGPGSRLEPVHSSEHESPEPRVPEPRRRDDRRHGRR